MSALSFRLNRVFRPLLHRIPPARPEEVEAFLFPASPFRLENEMTGTNCPSARSAGDDDGNRLPYGNRRRQLWPPSSLLLFCLSRSPCSCRRPLGPRLLVLFPSHRPTSPTVQCLG